MKFCKSSPASCCSSESRRVKSPPRNRLQAACLALNKRSAAKPLTTPTCHGSELRSTDREIPHLSDKSFKFGWIGRTIAEKYELVRDTMPPKEEHSLSDQVHLDIVTYILKFNKVPAGDQELKPDLEILKQITVAAPPG